jgi:hypothetical protein
MFKNYKNKVENQLNKKIKVIKVIKVENTKHLLMNYILKMVLSTKLPL